MANVVGEPGLVMGHDMLTGIPDRRERGLGFRDLQFQC